jgi:hypothetical protein
MAALKRRPLAAVVLGFVLLTAACGGSAKAVTKVSASTPLPPTVPPTTAPTSTSVPPAPTTSAAPVPPRVPLALADPSAGIPVAISIPRLWGGEWKDVTTEDQPVISAEAGKTTWWPKVHPGAAGPALIAGHVIDVFAQLESLQTGDEVLVKDDAGVTRRFIVNGERTKIPKEDEAGKPVPLPADFLGSHGAEPMLVVSTCTGDRRDDGHLKDNVYLMASYTGVVG